VNHGDVSKEIAAGLLELRARIEAAKVPSSKLDESINIATWNIREFGRGRRTDASIHYIAEILGQFDLVGIVELQENLGDLGRVLQILGPYWRAVYSDVIPDYGGDYERLGYIYDTRAVLFNGLAAEADSPRKKVGDEYIPEISFWRAPYLASFRAGSYDFVVLSVHVRWGDSVAARAAALEALAKWIFDRQSREHTVDRDIIVMGDFNIPSKRSSTYAAITKYGLQIPSKLAQRTFGSNLEKDKHYDQILHYPRHSDAFTNAGGILDFYIDAKHIKELYPGGLTKDKFTYQMSDHLPLWMQINTDLESQKLEQIVNG
jgi:endonuclease/exonuclease/phosphatase family metal-dependent hydrolase